MDCVLRGIRSFRRSRKAMQFQSRVSNPSFFMHQSRLDNWLRHFASSTALDQHVSQILVKNSSRSTSIPRPFVLENSLRHCQRLPRNCVLVLGNLDSRREAEECTHCIAFELVAAYFVSWVRVVVRGFNCQSPWKTTSKTTVKAVIYPRILVFRHCLCSFVVCCHVPE